MEMSEEEESSQVPKKVSPEETEPAKPEKTGLFGEPIEDVETSKPVCPVPPEHVKLFEECCDKYQKGEMSDIEVMENVITTLKKIKKEE